MAEFKWFRSKVTGKVAQFPAHFADFPGLEEVDSSDVSCYDCTIQPDEPVYGALVDTSNETQTAHGTGVYERTVPDRSTPTVANAKTTKDK